MRQRPETAQDMRASGNAEVPATAMTSSAAISALRRFGTT
jgi:hypothetical protein